MVRSMSERNDELIHGPFWPIANALESVPEGRINEARRVLGVPPVKLSPIEEPDRCGEPPWDGRHQWMFLRQMPGGHGNMYDVFYCQKCLVKREIPA